MWSASSTHVTNNGKDLVRSRSSHRQAISRRSHRWACSNIICVLEISIAYWYEYIIIITLLGMRGKSSLLLIKLFGKNWMVFYGRKIVKKCEEDHRWVEDIWVLFLENRGGYKITHFSVFLKDRECFWCDAKSPPGTYLNRYGIRISST